MNRMLTFIVILLILLCFWLFYYTHTQKIYVISCFNSRFGCCPDNFTAKKNIYGSNCRGF